MRRRQGPTIALGIDGGFAAIGWARVLLTEESADLEDFGVFRTEKCSKKQHTFAADDNMRRAQEIAAFLRDGHSDVAVVCAEAKSFPRNASAAAKVSMAFGALAYHLVQTGVPFVQEGPKKLKLAVAGSATASKELVQEHLRHRFGAQHVDRVWADSGLPGGMREHAFDALAAVVACLGSDVVRAVRRSR